MIWTVWWAWIAGGFLIGAVELLLPGFIFLGFAIGAAMTGVLIGIGVLTGASLPMLLLVFSLVSLAAWGGLRLVLGKQPGQVKIWTRDINDN